MKKTLLFLLALAFAGSVSALDNAGGIANWKTQKNGNGDIVIYGIQVDPSGTPIPTPVAGGSNVVLNGVSGVAATSYYDKLTWTAGSVVSWSEVGTFTVSATSPTASMSNVTYLAGTNLPCVVCLSSNGGSAAGFRVQFPTDSTPRGVTANVGAYIAASTTTQCFGPMVPGTHIEAAGVAGTSSVQIQVQKPVRVAVP